MEKLQNFGDVNNKIITIRNQNVILDSDVAKLYGVETRNINKAVTNNPKKFPEGYILSLQSVEKQELVENLHRFDYLKHSSASTKAFTEKGLYMLATILKSDRAIEATIAIVEAFAKLKELTNNIAFLNSIDPEVIEPEIIESSVEKTGSLLNDLFFSGLPTSAETSFELNLGLMKAKHSVKRENDTLKQELSEMKKMMTEIQKQLQKEK